MSSFTNQEQFEHLVDWMCKHPDIADGVPREYGKKVLGMLMEGLAEELNILGPPHKQVYQWRKVWTDMRSFTKKKLRENLVEGRNHRLNSRERRIIKLLDLEKSIREEQSKMKQDQDTNDLKWDESESLVYYDKDGDDAMNNSTSDKNSTDSTKFNIERDYETLDILSDTQVVEGNTNSIGESPKQSGAADDIIKILKQHVEIQNQQLQQQQALTSVMMKFEKNLIELNKAKSINTCLLEENNKLLKLIIYRSTKTEDPDQYKQSQEMENDDSSSDS